MSGPMHPQFPGAARGLKSFFAELAGHFLEREQLFLQLQLALLSREHVLVFGPPGTAKSQLALAVMKRIVDASSGAPSVFSKQIAETTVQTDLVGPVDFKVLTRTGRTEHLTDEGILGSIHGILDEVFDGREMLLRSILNLLEEREFKSGNKTTVGRTECTVMTSNRYLSEVVSRSPELMLAFADRISYVCFVPKGFARPASRAEMLRRAALRERPEFKAHLTIQDLDVLQEVVENVQVPAEVLEGLERLADEFETSLAKAAQAQPAYRPTKYFSNRTLVKSIKALKASVVLEAVQRTRTWPLRAELRDLSALLPFYGLGGPAAEDLTVHLKTATDLRERVQLEAAQLEGRVFSECLSKVLADLVGGAEREAATRELGPPIVAANAAADALCSAPLNDLLRAARATAQAAKVLAGLLSPPPRHPANVEAIRGAMARMVEAFATRVASAEIAQVGIAAFLEIVGEVVASCSGGELTARLLERSLTAARQGFETLADTLQVARFDAGRRKSLDHLEEAAPQLAKQFEALEQAATELASRADAAPESFRAAAEASRQARGRCALALVQSAQIAVRGELGTGSRTAQEIRTLSTRLARLEGVVAGLDPSVWPVREAATPQVWAEAVWLSVGTVPGVAQLQQRLTAALGSLALPGPLAGRILGDGLPKRIQAVCAEEEKKARAAVPFPESQADIHPALQSLYPSDRPSELQAVLALRASLAIPADEAGSWTAACQAAGDADLACVEALVGFVDLWLSRLGAKDSQLPKLGPAEASGVLRKVFESKLPQVVYYDRPLSRALTMLDDLEAQAIVGAAGLRPKVLEVSERATRFCEHLLECAAG